MNLHLYIPAHSAHPNGLLKSLVHGQLYRFWTQNSEMANFKQVTKAFYEHLVNRGYKQEVLNTHFRQAAEHLQRKEAQGYRKSTTTADDESNLFFHLQYHPHQIPKDAIRKFYNATCANTFNSARRPMGKNTLDIRRLTVAYSRAPNLRNKLCSSQLQDYPGQNVSDVLKSK